MRRLMMAVALLVPSLAGAQDAIVEITPTVGYRRGGGITVEDRAFVNRNVDVDLSARGSFGLRIGFNVSRSFQLELMVDRQNGSLHEDRGLFGEQPGGVIPIGDASVLDFNVTYYHAGVVWHLTPGPNRWYLLLSAGGTRLDPNVPLEAVNRRSASAGGGVKLKLGERSALLLEGRFFWTDTSDLRPGVQHFDHQDCYIGAPCTYTYRYRTSLEQAQISVGYTFKL